MHSESKLTGFTGSVNTGHRPRLESGAEEEEELLQKRMAQPGPRPVHLHTRHFLLKIRGHESARQSEANAVMKMDDPGLILQIQQGKPEAIQKVAKTYLIQIFRAARAAGLDVDRAEEVTQNTFTTFVERAKSFEGRSHIRTWLFGILYNKIAEARRRLSRDHQIDDIEEVMESRFNRRGHWSTPPQEVDSLLYGSELRNLLEDCLQGVPFKQRMAFVLREVEDLRTEEICKILDVTPTHSSVLLFRARNRLRECLEARGVRPA